jgi:uncharacterized protein YjdB
VTTGRWGAVVSGGTEVLAVTVLDARGVPIEPAPRPRFVSRQPDVVRVDTLGRVTGVRPGTAIIVAILPVGAREVSDSVTVPHVVPLSTNLP